MCCRAIESAQPSIPFTITEATFDLVEEHVRALEYPGYLALSCDDSKLLPALRLHYDATQKTHMLVGGINGPLRVADPEQVRRVMESADVQKGTKVSGHYSSTQMPLDLSVHLKLRLWCLQVPLPKIAPVIVAAIAIPNNLPASQLAEFSETILRGLLARNLRVISCSHDGTETERGTQRLLSGRATSRRTYRVPCTRDSHYDLCIEVPVFDDQPVVFVQDSMHARKTYRNNEFAGSRLMVIGNFTILYRRIRDIAFEDDSPLYRRDVEKLDRQDDNAAARLFSAQTLEYIISKHSDYLGEIVYLFVFGELVDAWQNRLLPHVERLKMALRAHYFVKMWQIYLVHAGYSINRHCLSREALDITRILIESLIALILVHRDYSSTFAIAFPLLPWMHSTEPCEHVFGEARQVVDDFTFLDFHHMVAKLRIKLWEATKLGEASDPKARACGYNHTYLDARGIDMQALSSYPDDLDVQRAALEAFEEAESLFALLGVIPHQLHSCATPSQDLPAAVSQQQPTKLDAHSQPYRSGCVSGYRDDDEIDSEGEDEDDDAIEVSEAAQLHAILQQEERSQWDDGRTMTEDDQLAALAMASVSVSMDEMCRM